MATLFGSIPCVDPAILRAECVARKIPVELWWNKANTFSWGVGEQPGEGKILLCLADLDALDQAADHVLKFQNDAASNTAAVSLTKITLLRAECVTPGAEGDTSAVYLCDVVDRRFHLARIPLDKAYNVSAADGSSYLTQTKNGGSAWTWSGIVNDLCTTLGISIAVVPFTPHGTPENLTYYGSFAWRALCDVANRLGCAVKYDPVTDVFTLVRLGAANATGEAAITRLKRDRKRTWDGYPVEPERGRRPEKVRVRFVRRPLPTDGSSPIYTVDITLAATTGVASGTYVQLDDDLTALGATGTPSNSATLATRAQERADDWVRKLTYFEDRFLVVYRDFQPDAATIVGSTVGRVAMDDRGGQMRTAVVSKPDGLLEKWGPLRGLPSWWPPGAADCCGWWADYYTRYGDPFTIGSGIGDKGLFVQYAGPGVAQSTAGAQMFLGVLCRIAAGTGRAELSAGVQLQALFPAGGSQPTTYAFVVFAQLVGRLVTPGVSGSGAWAPLTNTIAVVSGQNLEGWKTGDLSNVNGVWEKGYTTHRVIPRVADSDIEVTWNVYWTPIGYVAPPGLGGVIAAVQIGRGGTFVSAELKCCLPDVDPPGPDAGDGSGSSSGSGSGSGDEVPCDGELDGVDLLLYSAGTGPDPLHFLNTGSGVWVCDSLGHAGEELYFEGGTWHLRNNAGTIVLDADSFACDPFSATFTDGTALGYPAGDLTVEAA